MIKKPVYQGQIDVFCAAYAAINSIRIAQGINLINARKLLHEALLNVAKDLELFQKVLDQKTDYVFWVDNILEQESKRGSITVKKAFPHATEKLDNHITSDDVWGSIINWLSNGKKRSCLFQFIRYLPTKGLFLQHWTCGYNLLYNNTLLLFADSSLESDSLQYVYRKELGTTFKNLHDEVIIKPYTLRLVEPILIS